MFCICFTNNDKTNTDSTDPFVLTAPLYYVNAPPHMGSAYTSIAADAIARFQEPFGLLGKKVAFSTGTDEHGEKIAAAAAAGLSSPNTATLYLKHIAYDKFIRTTDPKHEEIVKEFYSRVLANGDIYKVDYEGLYCINCEEYKDEKELLENHCCPIHLKPCVARKEDNYYFALSKYQKPLEETLTRNPDFVQPSFRLNENIIYAPSILHVQSWIKSGLSDFSISRASVDWGVPVPNDDKQTIYVWFDALLGYISALSGNKDQPNLQTAVSSGWPASLLLIGKDILRFHAVYWLAMLTSAGLTVPKKDGMKMGKSLGNTLEPNELVHNFGPDAVRYFFLKEVEFGNDGDYSEDRFINIVNAHLANTIGNLLNHTRGLLRKNCKSTLVVDSAIAAEGTAFKDNVEKLVENVRGHYENLSLSSACEVVLEIGNAGNSYMDEEHHGHFLSMGDLVIILEAMRIIAVALSPVTPNLKLENIRTAWLLKQPVQLCNLDFVMQCDTKWGGLKGGQVMAQPKPVFARIEQRAETEDRSELAAKMDLKNKGKPKAIAVPVAEAEA
ncbi:hypothetical protein Patl1_05402 [Pistacia atlantica]|uniref:Uncharacterized protein n=1 Tax=Pistacia atlantica TaxID=434234 RepID=A0ACC1BQX5_9ROSI|nr:hypothetical protein Patl1_05402 [Pistacia atlantica]